MKVLFDHPQPFSLAHGGFQIQIEQTKAALEQTGVEVDYVRWWDPGQAGDLIHFFGRPSAAYIDLAHQQGLATVFTDLLGGLSSRTTSLRLLQKGVIRIAREVLPKDFTARLAWDAYNDADACIALTELERQLMIEMFSAPPERVRVVPNGVERVFLESKPATRDKWLVCVATIRDVKRVLELAEAAVLAQTPIWFIGRPYSASDPYANRFLSFATANAALIRYAGAVNERSALADVYRKARGFVLVSQWESLSIAALEAAACGCPILLSDRPWARSAFGPHATYCPMGSAVVTAEALRNFYGQAPQLKPPPPPKSWKEVAGELTDIYKQAIARRH
jgi:glycosyltransferase involved in cell wall biosynthesis